MDVAEEKEIVIVGAGICGLATALALHRKGIRSVVLERSESLRATGAAIGILPNGWRALDHLGVGSKLRPTAIPIQATRDVWLGKGLERERPISDGEARCLKRSDLIEMLADDLPLGTIRFGCEILSVKLDVLTSNPVLQLRDGSYIKAGVLIGCDGVNSVVADFLELKPTKLLSTCAVRGFTNYSCGHGFAPEFVRTIRDGILTGRIPANDRLVYWFVARQCTSEDSKVSKDPELIRQSTLEAITDFPTELIEMIKNGDLNSLHFTRLRYRAPWDLLLGSFRKGNVTVAGDAMHVMGPFLGQGGSAGLEDAIVLARCLAQKMYEVDLNGSGRQMMVQQVGVALDQYVKERRMRVVRLSTQTYLTGLLLGTSSSLVKFIGIVFMAILFSDPISHTRYDCGHL